LGKTVKIYRRLTALVLVSFVATGIPAADAPAATLSELLPKLVKDHNRIKSAESSVGAAKERIREARGALFPTLNVVAFAGSEQYNKPEADDTRYVTREVDFTVTQRLFDFGATDSAVHSVRLNFDLAKKTLALTRQSLILEATTAYLNVFRSKEALEFALQSEKNIKKQTELEDALVQRGAGLATDVLQAKVQLAGAEARRVRAEGDLKTSINRYRAVFGDEPGNLDYMIKPKIPVQLVPENLEMAIEAAMTENLQLGSAKLTTDIAREAVTTAEKSNFLPYLDAIVDANYKKDVGSTKGFQREVTGTVQLTWPFNLGLTALNTLKASEGDLTATQKQYADARDLIEEVTRNAWDALVTAQQNAELLRNQANIAGEFLQFARKERTLGRRSLLDVLAGETALINSNSDAASAEIDVGIAVYTLLDAMARLDLSVFEDQSQAPKGPKGKPKKEKKG